MSEKHSNETEQRKKRSIAGRVFLWFLLLIFLAGLGAGGWLYYKYGRDLLECRDRALVIAARSSRSDFANDQTSILYYSDGNVMQILSGSKNVYYLPFSAIPDNAVNAVLAVEDRKFYTHKGYDVYAIARAARAYIENEGAIKQGGSTITQQLARSIYL
ncbi:MAG: transglycosylase domain-containing protein, partial [Lachnospiraceae bacterium]|nr:transglycosylase domain-containing protein [Lachnospiraceae bacterium]